MDYISETTRAQVTATVAARTRPVVVTNTRPDYQQIHPLYRVLSPITSGGIDPLNAGFGSRRR
jgi:hypothetical protein